MSFLSVTWALTYDPDLDNVKVNLHATNLE